MHIWEVCAFARQLQHLVQGSVCSFYPLFGTLLAKGVLPAGFRLLLYRLVYGQVKGSISIDRRKCVFQFISLPCADESPTSHCFHTSPSSFRWWEIIIFHLYVGRGAISFLTVLANLSPSQHCNTPLSCSFHHIGGSSASLQSTSSNTVLHRRLRPTPH